MPPGSRSTLEAPRATGLTIADNGRGIPVDEHPKYPGKSALEVILTTLHSGGKFSRQGLCDLGRPARRRRLVVNALSTDTIVEVARNKELYRQTFSRGAADLEAGASSGRPRTGAAPPSPSRPDAEIFGDDAQVQAGAALPAGAVQGLSVRRASRSAGNAIPR